MNRACAHTLRGVCYRGGLPRSVKALTSNTSCQFQYSTLKDKLLKLLPFNQRLQQKLNLVPSDAGSRNEDEIRKNKAFASQQVTPVIIEMVGKSISLNDMLYITDKILPKTTLADRVIILNILTQKLYNDVIDRSHVFMRPRYHSEIRLRLYLDGVLSKTVQPLGGTATLRSLIKGIVDTADHMNTRQILDVFFNLQLLDWPKESREMFQMFDMVQRMKFITFNIQELLRYTDAMAMYMPVLYKRHTVVFMYKWFEKNTLRFDNSYIYDAIDRLEVDLKMLRSPLGRNVIGKIVKEIRNQVDISELGLRETLVLFNFLSKISNRKVEDHQKADITHLRISLEEQVVKKLDDLSINDVIYIKKHFKTSFILSDRMGGFLQDIGRRCKALLEKKHSKCDALLSLMALASLSDIDEGLSSEGKAQMKNQVLECVSNMDILGLLAFGSDESVIIKFGLVDLLQRRIKGYALSDMFEKDLFTEDEILASCCYILIKLSYHVKVDESLALLVRDKYIDYYRKRTVYDLDIQRRVLRMLLRFNKMTPTGVEFLENISHLSSFKLMKIANDLQHLKSRTLVDPYVKQKVTDAGYARCNTAWSMLFSVVVNGIIHDFKRSTWTPSPSNQRRNGRFRMDPILQVLSDEKIHEICQKVSPTFIQEQLFSLYKHCSSHPEQLVDILNKNIDHVELLYWLVTDAFFLGGPPVDMQRLEDSLNKRDKDGDYSVEKELLQTSCDWKMVQENAPEILQYVKLPPSVRDCVHRAFNGRVQQGVFWNDKLYVDSMVLLSGKNSAVELKPGIIEKAAKHSKHQKVAFFYRISNKVDVDPQKEFAKSRLIQELQTSGFKCVVVWDQEWNSIANRTVADKMKLIKSKVSQNSTENTGSMLSYNLDTVKQGPYKEFFVN